jgi:hypothetical protein
MRKSKILNEQLIDRGCVLSLLSVLNYVKSWLWRCYIYKVSTRWLYSRSEVCNTSSGFVAGFIRWWQTTLETKGKEGGQSLRNNEGGRLTQSINSNGYCRSCFYVLWIVTCLDSLGILRVKIKSHFLVPIPQLYMRHTRTKFMAWSSVTVTFKYLALITEIVIKVFCLSCP